MTNAFQAELMINDYPADCVELVREVLASVFDNDDTTGFAISPVEPNHGIWLVELPEWAEDEALRDGWFTIDTGRNATTIEMP